MICRPRASSMPLSDVRIFELVMKSGKYRELLHAYLASISFADAQIGRLIDTLDASGEADNTIIVFWSDHGWHFGEKEHLHKMTLWERSTRIPFILVDPRGRLDPRRVASNR